MDLTRTKPLLHYRDTESRFRRGQLTSASPFGSRTARFWMPHTLRSRACRTMLERRWGLMMIMVS